MTDFDNQTPKHSEAIPEGLGDPETSARQRSYLDGLPGWRQYYDLDDYVDELSRLVAEKSELSWIFRLWIYDSIEQGLRNAFHKIPDYLRPMTLDVFKDLFDNRDHCKEFEENALECLRASLNYRGAPHLMMAMEKKFLDGVFEKQGLVMQESMKEE